MRIGLRAFGQSDRGAAAIEFALLLPVMLLFVAGITEFGRFYSVSNAANRLATQYVGAWADCSDVTSGACSAEVTTFVSPFVIANLAPELTASKTSLAMFQVAISGTTVRVLSAYPVGTSLTAAQQTAALAALKSGQVGMIVTVNYQHSLDFFSSSMSKYLSSLLAISYTVVQLQS